MPQQTETNIGEVVQALDIDKKCELHSLIFREFRRVKGLYMYQVLVETMGEAVTKKEEDVEVSFPDGKVPRLAQEYERFASLLRNHGIDIRPTSELISMASQSTYKPGNNGNGSQPIKRGFV